MSLTLRLTDPCSSRPIPSLVATTHRFNMELDFQCLFGLHVYSCTNWLRPRNPPPPPPRMSAHIRGRYWSAKIDDISL
jgi:hypothetical protein